MSINGNSIILNPLTLDDESRINLLNTCTITGQNLVSFDTEKDGKKEKIKYTLLQVRYRIEKGEVLELSFKDDTPFLTIPEGDYLLVEDYDDVIIRAPRGLKTNLSELPRKERAGKRVTKADLLINLPEKDHKCCEIMEFQDSKRESISRALSEYPKIHDVLGLNSKKKIHESQFETLMNQMYGQRKDKQTDDIIKDSDFGMFFKYSTGNGRVIPRTSIVKASDLVRYNDPRDINQVDPATLDSVSLNVLISIITSECFFGAQKKFVTYLREMKVLSIQSNEPVVMEISNKSKKFLQLNSDEIDDDLEEKLKEIKDKIKEEPENKPEITNPSDDENGEEKDNTNDDNFYGE